MDKVKIGVIGVGHLGRFHAMNYAKLAGVDLVGVTDTNMDRAREIADEFGCPAIESMDELLDQVDGVSVAVPTDYHFKVGRKVLAKGVHCLMEKPITQNLEEADALIQMAKENDAILQVGHVERFNPAFRALQHMALNPQFIESHRLAPFNPRGTEVAVVLDLMIHDIEIALHLVDSPVKSVDASGVAVVSDTIDICNARIRFENGAVANLTASRISQKKMRKTRLFQRDAYITVDFLDRVTEIFSLDEKGGAGFPLGEIGVGDRKKTIHYQKPKTPEAHGLEIELDAFAATIRGETPEVVTGADGRKAMEVAMEVLNCMG